MSATQQTQTLTAQLAEQKASTIKKLPQETVELMLNKTAELENSGIAENALKVGDIAPDFQLPNPVGDSVSLSDLLKNGPVVLTFYRGGWCPYCNLELRALQQQLPFFAKYNAQIVAVSPQTPDNSLSVQEIQELEFAVLSDASNNVARNYGLVFTLDEKLKPIYKSFGIDIEASNGDESYELPIPATYVIDKEGVIRYAFINTDYTQRAEPAEVLAAVEQL